MQRDESKAGSGIDIGQTKKNRSAGHEFIGIIDEFKGYLGALKQGNRFFPGISDRSEKRIEEWGQSSSEDVLFFSQGPETADLCLVDSDNRFFSGKSGALLVKILGAMKLTPDIVFICNCDSPPSIKDHVRKHKPKMMITLGSRAGKRLSGRTDPLASFRGRFFDYHGVRVMPTFHPSLLIKDPSYKRDVWEDMKQVMAVLGQPRDT